MTFVTPASALTASTVFALWAVSVVGWLRTRPLRGGRSRLEGASPRRPRLGGAHTSLATYLPGLAGVLMAVTGGLMASRWAGPLGIGVAASGVGIAWAGFAARVTALEIHPSGLVIRYQARRSFSLRWNEVRTITPPRWPLGGWRLAGDRKARVLMASDLLGLEDLLRQTIAWAGLHYDRGSWRSAR